MTKKSLRAKIVTRIGVLICILVITAGLISASEIDRCVSKLKDKGYKVTKGVWRKGTAAWSEFPTTYKLIDNWDDLLTELELAQPEMERIEPQNEFTICYDKSKNVIFFQNGNSSVAYYYPSGF